MRRVALEVRQRLKEVPDTATSFIVGGRSEQMRIEISPERLAGFGIGISQIANAVKAPMSIRTLVLAKMAAQAIPFIPAVSSNPSVILKVWLLVFVMAVLSICVMSQPSPRVLVKQPMLLNIILVRPPRRLVWLKLVVLPL